MFAVPGWSVSADALKTQRTPLSTSNTNNTPGKSQDAIAKPSKKRKRDRSHPKNPVVTRENVADLWKKHIEGKASEKSNEDTSARTNERRKKKKRLRDMEGDDGKNLYGLQNGTTSANEVSMINKDARTLDSENHSREARDSESASLSGKHKVPQEEEASGSMRISSSKAEGKAKYEERKLLALKKREQKSQLQARGDIPPSRRSPSLEASATINTSNPTANPSSTSRSVPNANSKTATEHPKPSKQSPNTLQATGLPAHPHPTKSLTPLQLRMREKLTSARFRHINQTLYTTPSSHALSLFTESPSSYTSYHAGFQAQVALWPQNPINTFISELQARAPIPAPRTQKQKFRDERKKNKISQPLSSSLEPLPRSSQICSIADLGCGDAVLAGTFIPALSQKHHLRILSFDLCAGEGPNAQHITIADLCKLPLRNGEIDLAILSLALMNTNWVEGVDEVSRIVRTGGEVWVAEVRSRFARKSRKPRGGKRIGDVKDDEHDDIISEEDQVQNKNDDTDLDPFVAVWRKRGFAMQGPPDLGNRMFVRLKFVKTPEKTAEAPSRGGSKSLHRDYSRGHGGSMLSSTEEKQKETEEEGKVLKPCVYKTR